jgi:hypothetical protein
MQAFSATGRSASDPEGRKLFEQFLERVNRLEQRQAPGAASDDATERA